MARMNLLRAAIVALFAITVCLWSMPAAADDSAATYKAKCAMCHGADGKGETPVGKKMGVHDFGSADVQAMSDADLSEAIAKGKNKMPGYAKSLNEAAIKDMVAYVRSLGKKK